MIEDYLKTYADSQPDKLAVITPELTLTYRQLYQRVLDKVTAFSGMKHKAIVFPTTQDEDFLITYFAIHLAGAVAVPLERNLPEGRRKQIIDELEGKTFPAEAADILFTTGTTGLSKGVIISHSTIEAEAENLDLAQKFSSDLLFFICGPLNHIGCLSKIYPVLREGATLYILKGMKDINAFFKALDYPVTKIATFLVPANIRILTTFSSKKLSQYADKIDFIETGAAPMMHADMEKICRILPHSRLYNTYASTETGIIATFNYNCNGPHRCEEGCLGKPMKNSSFEITNKGTIACHGDTLMLGYVGEGNNVGNILHDGTVYTSDLGRIDEEGMIHMLGREDDVINTGGLKVAPTEVESYALEIPEIADCICIAACHPLLGTVPKLLVKMKEGEKLNKKKTALYLSTKLERYKVPVYYEQVESVNRTYNGKLDRKSYRTT